MAKSKSAPKRKPPAARKPPQKPSRKLPLRLEYRSPAELNEHPRNWRRHPEAQTRAIADLIAEVGWAGACLVNERTGRMLDGHARRKVALSRGEPLVPVLVGDWSEEQEQLILATLDPVAGMAATDPVALAALLADIDTESDAVAALLAGLAEAGLTGVAAGAGGDEFDPTPAAADGPTRAAAGDLWVIGGRHRLLVADCTDAAGIGRLFAGAVPALMVTDPPYGVEYDPTWRHRAGANVSKRTGTVMNDDRADWTTAWRLFPGNVAYVWHGALHGRTVFDSLAAAGFDVRAQLVWVKPRLALSRGHYHWQHEPALVAERPAEAAAADAAADGEGELGYLGVRRGTSARWAGGRKQTTVWNVGYAGEPKTFHGTQKPVECMARPIRNHGATGDAVYDPFLGSGTTLVAAHRLGRTCYGCELDRRYADVILRRAEAEGLAVERAA